MFFKTKKDPYKYRFLCKNCDIFFEREDARKRNCPICGQHKYTEVHTLINKETGEKSR